MAKIFLHVGAHKCASTTIQYNCRDNISVLRAHGYSYLGPSDISRSPLGRYFKYLSKSKFKDTAERESLKRLAKASLNELLGNVQDSCRGILISWEGFLGHSSLDVYGGIYTHASDVSASIAEIFSDHDLTLLVVFRRQDDFIESCYLQQIKELRAVDFCDFVSKINVHCLSWEWVINNFVRDFGVGKLRCVPFELIKDLGGSGFVTFCLEYLLGCNGVAAGFVWRDLANPSISKVGVDMALKVYPGLDGAERLKFMRVLFGSLSSKDFPKGKYMDDFSRGLVLAYCMQSNKRVLDACMALPDSELTNTYENVRNYYLAG